MLTSCKINSGRSLSFLALLAAFGLFTSAVAYSEPAGLRLIQRETGKAEWMTQEQINEIMIQSHNEGRCAGFMDITDHPDELGLEPQAVAPYMFNMFTESFDLGNGPTHPERVTPYLELLSGAEIQNSIKILSAFKNRYYESETGLQAAQLIEKRFSQLAAFIPQIQVRTFEHRFKQPSVIARLPGQGPRANEVIVIGGHLDSINQRGPGSAHDAHAPGADDNASGMATVLEIFRVLTKIGIAPNRTIDFIGYAGEEVGLLGSQDIAAEYRKRGVNVVGVVQFDMTMFPGEDNVISFMTDYTNPELTKFMQILVDEYVKAPWNTSKCGYPCSDHASWYRAGYPAVMPFETTMNRWNPKYNPKIHTAGDDVSNLTLSHGMKFAKLGLAFALELGYGTD
jgi:bacterial leucyl aminopeptidase